MTKASPPDSRRFRSTIGLFATGVAVVATRIEDEAVGMTANAISSVSLEPMLVLFCPGKNTRLGRRINSISGYTINLLRDDQQALSTFFAGGWKEATPPPFTFLPTRTAPRLEGALASIECETHQVIEAGDHWIVLGRVLELHVGPRPHRPLLFFEGRYRHVNLGDSAPAPELADIHDTAFDLHWY